MQDKTDQILIQIKNELEILNYDVKNELIKNFSKEFLTSSLRRKMFNLFDGKTSAKDIANKVGCGERNVQVLIKDLTDMNLIEITKVGNTQLPKKNLSLIATYYAQKFDLIEEE